MINIKIVSGQNTIFGSNCFLTFNASPNDTIQQLKEKVKEELKVAHEFSLYAYPGKLLKDGTLEDNGIQSSCCIHPSISFNKIKIYIETNTKKFSLYVDTNAIVKLVKEKIYLKEGIPVTHQRLYWYGNCLDDATTLTYNRIREENVIELIKESPQTMILPCKPLNGECRNIEVDKDSTIYHLRAVVAETMGRPLDCVRITAKGKNLCDEEKITRYPIQEGTTVFVLFRLRARLQPITKDHHKNHLIDGIKDIEVDERKGVLIKEKKLISSEEDLRNERTLGGRNISKTSDVYSLT